MPSGTRHIDQDSPVVKELEALIQQHNLTEEELDEAVDIAMSDCDHIGPTLDEFDGTYSYEKCAKCGTVLNKWPSR